MSDIYKGLWNTDSGQAPRSHDAFTATVRDGKQYSRKTRVDVWILAAYIGSEGPTVRRIRWLPDDARWECMTKGQAPLAWMPYPEFPEELLS